jgi:hypothetical protein
MLQKGDKVELIDNRGWATDLIVGEIYTVFDIHYRLEGTVYSIKVQLHGYWIPIHQFRTMNETRVDKIINDFFD